MYYTAYYRVSTAAQGRSHLGLDAQRAAVLAHMSMNGNKLAGEYTEIESGRKNDRPELLKAIAEVKKHKGRLIIAKLDRLGRNLAFVANLMEAGVPFIAADMPEANELTLHIMAAMAQFEAKAISARTKAALEQAKKRGVKLGGKRPGDFRNHDRMKSSQAFREKMRPIINQLSGLSTRQIADELNRRGIPAFNGGKWHASSVQRMKGIDMAEKIRITMSFPAEYEELLEQFAALENRGVANWCATVVMQRISELQGSGTRTPQKRESSSRR